jgi:phosphate:Na+ symporter
LNKSITAFLTKLVSKDLSDEDDTKVGTYYHVVSDIERVGDYAENIMEYSQRLRNDELSFSSDAKKELAELVKKVNELYECAFSAFSERNIALLEKVAVVEEEIDDLCVVLENRHIDRVKEGTCTAELGSVYLQTVSNLERVADHITNVAFSIKKYLSAPKRDN